MRSFLSWLHGLHQFPFPASKFRVLLVIMFLEGRAFINLLIKVRRGNSVLAFPRHKFAIITKTTAIFSWYFDLFVTFFIDCGHLYVPNGVFCGSTSRPHMGQFLQGGKNGRLMSFFFKSRASV